MPGSPRPTSAPHNRSDGAPPPPPPPRGRRRTPHGGVQQEAEALTPRAPPRRPAHSGDAEPADGIGEPGGCLQIPPGQVSRQESTAEGVARARRVARGGGN